MIEVKGSNTVMDFGTHFQFAFQKNWVILPCLQQCMRASFTKLTPTPALQFTSFLTSFQASWALAFQSCFFVILFVSVNLDPSVLLAFLDLSCTLLIHRISPQYCTNRTQQGNVDSKRDRIFYHIYFSFFSLLKEDLLEWEYISKLYYERQKLISQRYSACLFHESKQCES